MASCATFTWMVDDSSLSRGFGRRRTVNWASAENGFSRVNFPLTAANVSLARIVLERTVFHVDVAASVGAAASLAAGALSSASPRTR